MKIGSISLPSSWIRSACSGAMTWARRSVCRRAKACVSRETSELATGKRNTHDRRESPTSNGRLRSLPGTEGWTCETSPPCRARAKLHLINYGRSSSRSSKNLYQRFSFALKYSTTFDQGPDIRSVGQQISLVKRSRRNNYMQNSKNYETGVAPSAEILKSIRQL